MHTVPIDLTLNKSNQTKKTGFPIYYNLFTAGGRKLHRLHSLDVRFWAVGVVVFGLSTMLKLIVSAHLTNGSPQIWWPI